MTGLEGTEADPDRKAEDRRRETIRRLQVGGVGLVMVTLLIALSTLLAGGNVSDADRAKAQAEAAGVAAPVEDPATQPAAIAPPGPAGQPGAVAPATDLVPSGPMPGPAGNGNAAPPAGVPSVPDLEPDPAIREPARR